MFEQDDKLSNFFKERASALENRDDMMPRDAVWDRLSKRLDDLPQTAAKLDNSPDKIGLPAPLEKSTSRYKLYFAMAALLSGLLIGGSFLFRNTNTETVLAETKAETQSAGPQMQLNHPPTVAENPRPNAAIALEKEFIAEPNAERAKKSPFAKQTEEELDDIIKELSPKFNINVSDEEIHSIGEEEIPVVAAAPAAPAPAPTIAENDLNKASEKQKLMHDKANISTIPYMALERQLLYPIVQKNKEIISIALNKNEILTYNLEAQNISIYAQDKQSTTVYHFKGVDSRITDFTFQDIEGKVLSLIIEAIEYKTIEIKR